MTRAQVQIDNVDLLQLSAGARVLEIESLAKIAQEAVENPTEDGTSE
jgi:hypothetical protein